MFAANRRDQTNGRQALAWRAYVDPVQQTLVSSETVAQDPFPTTMIYMGMAASDPTEFRSRSIGAVPTRSEEMAQGCFTNYAPCQAAFEWAGRSASAAFVGYTFGFHHLAGSNVGWPAWVTGNCQQGFTPHGRRAAPLPKWRLRRVVEYVEANIADEIRLEDLARTAGLTRMHFAAQFRKATGMRPHDYVLRCRVARAKAMLLNSDFPLLRIALDVGFKTQAHFSVVFKRFVGQAPYRWRQCNL